MVISIVHELLKHEAVCYRRKFLLCLKLFALGGGGAASSCKMRVPPMRGPLLTTKFSLNEHFMKFQAWVRGVELVRGKFCIECCCQGCHKSIVVSRIEDRK